MKDLISVIIPVYNVQDYLPACLECVCAQTYENLEIILVDDGATDGSGAICDTWAQKDPRIRVIHKANGGLSTARNAGINIARGRWITFVDSDDLIAWDMVEGLQRVIGEADIAMCDRQKFTDAPVPAQDSGLERYSGLDFLNKIYEAPRFIAAWGKLYKRELFQRLRFREGILHEDEDLLPQLIYEAKEIVYLRQEKYFYRVRPSSIMTSEFNKKRLDIIGVCKRRIDLFTQWGLTELRKKAVKDYYQHLKNLERQTAGTGWEEEHRLVQNELAQWPDYGVRFSLLEKLRQRI